MAEPQPLINALDPSVVDRLDPQFAEIYTKYQGNSLPPLIFNYLLTLAKQPQHYEPTK